MLVKYSGPKAPANCSGQKHPANCVLQSVLDKNICKLGVLQSVQHKNTCELGVLQSFRTKMLANCVLVFYKGLGLKNVVPFYKMIFSGQGVSLQH